MLGGDPNEIMVEIIRIFKEYKCFIVGADMGAGFVYNALLQTKGGLPLTGIQYSAQNMFLTYNPQFGRARWIVDKVSAVTLTFLGIIGGRIRFPKGPMMQTFKADLLSPFEHLIETSSGQKVKRLLRTPGKPDDFTHALTFANLIAAKLVLGSTLESAPVAGVVDEQVNVEMMQPLDYWNID